MSLMNHSISTKKSRVYDELGQGLKVFHSPQNAEADIVAVPGLGTDPEKCWIWPANIRDGEADVQHVSDDLGHERQAKVRKPFNWIKDPDGLARLFPKARILLYDYASAWSGTRKVRVSMMGICKSLLEYLKDKRKDDIEGRRPIIFIGHSMGGLVIAKMLCMATTRKDYESITTCTTGCMFFGSPFQGTDMAKMALYYNYVFGKESYEALLEFMRPDQGGSLEEVTQEFMELKDRLRPPIQVCCAYETVPTDFTSYISKATQRMPGIFTQNLVVEGMGRMLQSIGSNLVGTHFVKKESAVLPGCKEISITAGHSGLIKFESIEAERFVPVKVALQSMMSSARKDVRTRVDLSGKVLASPRYVKLVRQSLEGVHMAHIIRSQAKSASGSSWLTADTSFLAWLGSQRLDGTITRLWLKGGPGLGKTDAAMSAINCIDEVLTQAQKGSSSKQIETFAAHFMCASTPGRRNAEDVLKSLIIQIIDQEEILARHAKQFLPESQLYESGSSGIDRSRYEGSGSVAKATATVDNLWKCLQDMIADPVLQQVFIVLTNIHYLEDEDATNALLTLFQNDMVRRHGVSASPPKARWLITGRNDHRLVTHLVSEHIQVIDLENNSDYGLKIKSARRAHAREAVLTLKVTRGYTDDLAYYVRSSIANHAEDKEWIDVFCILLGNLSGDNAGLSTRQWLRKSCHSRLDQLIEHAFENILDNHPSARLQMAEVFRALIIAFDEPTLTELAVLTQIDEISELKELIKFCSPIITVQQAGEKKGRVIFTHSRFKPGILHVSDKHLDLSGNNTYSPDTKQYHGQLALRCFNYIRNAVGSMDQLSDPDYTGTALAARPLVEALDSTENSLKDRGDLAGLGSGTLGGSFCAYPLKFLLQHAASGFPDVSEDLYEIDPTFWTTSSEATMRWLRAFIDLSPDLRGFENPDGMIPLHLVAAVGALDLARVLVRQGDDQALSYRSDQGTTALHIAAFNNQREIVDVLLPAKADPNIGDGDIGIALHFASLHGHLSVMELLIEKKSNVNAFSQEMGPVINAAIKSGIVKGVGRILKEEVRFDLDYQKCEAPLSLSASISDPGLFREILQVGIVKWKQNTELLEQALLSSCFSGRVEIVQTLLDFEHEYLPATLDRAIFDAALESNWTAVQSLLKHVATKLEQHQQHELQMNDTFYLAAAQREDHQEVLQQIWSLSTFRIPTEIVNFALYQATALKKPSTVRWLLEECDANPDATADRPDIIYSECFKSVAPPQTHLLNAINTAANTGDKDLVQILLKSNANISDSSCFALQLAAKEGHVDVVKLLVEAGAAIDRRVTHEELDMVDTCALQLACDSARTGVVEYLLEQGANPNAGGGPFTNPITAAVRKSHLDILKLLLKAPGIEINVTGGEDQSTPLINAATFMSKEAVQLLLDQGAEINAVNPAGDSALVMAAWKGEKDCVELLCDRGAEVAHRSTGRGLAIEVAAQQSHPLCASILAKRMEAAVDFYRQLSEDTTLPNQLKASEAMVVSLQNALADMKTDLQVAMKDIDLAQLDKDSLLEANLHQNEDFKSVGQRIRAMDEERIELRKQLETSERRTARLSTEVDGMRRLVADQRALVLDVKKRTGVADLESKITELQDAAEQLQTAMEALETEKTTAWATLKSERDASKAKEIHIDQLAAELERMKRELQAAERNATPQANATSPPPTNGLGLQPYGSPGSPGSLGSQPYTPQMSPGLTARGSPALPARPGLGSPSSFRTVHGQHRPDGSFGGYRSDRASRRLTISQDNVLGGTIPVTQRSLSEASTNSDELYTFVTRDRSNTRQDSGPDILRSDRYT